MFNGWAQTGRTSLFFASNYFDQMYEAAVKSDQKGQGILSADLTAEQIREYRGTLDRAWQGRVRTADRSIEENLDLFEDMKNGKYRGRRKGTACKDRYGISEYQYERSGHLPCGTYDTSQYRR